MSAERVVLSCPHCGAPFTGAHDEPTTCRFCGVTSVPAAPSPAVEPSSHDGPPCPRCTAPLFEGSAGGATLLGCGRCGGVWLDNASAQRVLAARDGAIVELAARADARANAVAAVRVEEAACPVCRRALVTTTDPGSRVELDVCATHGTFFDRYELGLVMRAWGRSPSSLAPVRSRPTAAPDFRRSSDGGDGLITGALVAGGAFAIIGGLLSLSDS